MLQKGGRSPARRFICREEGGVIAITLDPISGTLEAGEGMPV